MPSALFHVRAAQILLERPGFPPGLKSAAERAPWALKLGSVFVDLPLYERFWLKVGLNLTRKPYPESRWGAVIHARGAGTLAAGLLCRRDGHEHETDALVAGLLSHIALDRCLHVPIEEAVRQHVRPEETRSQLHEALENYQSLMWHRELFGTDGLGCASLRHDLPLGPSQARELPKWLETIFREALADAYGRKPSEKTVRDWSNGLRSYSLLLSNRHFAKVSVQGSKKLAETRPWVADVDRDQSLEKGWAVAEGLCAEAEEAILSHEPTRLAEVVGNGPLV